MKYRLFNILSALSLLVCVAVVVLWMRSNSIHDYISFTKQVPGEALGFTLIYMDSGRGQVALGYDDDQISKPYWLGFHYFDDLAMHNPTGEWGFDYFQELGDAKIAMAIALPHWVLMLTTAILPMRWIWLYRRHRHRKLKGLPHLPDFWPREVFPPG